MKREGYEHSAAIPGGGERPRRGKDDADVRLR